ncbi:YegJ family protein [Chryseolinea lacunae]|uniref:DUF2314 domain-containing protein n=1 Tax=Chryseolinea lacunae TaxID=2801331 RepID=A0ABS1L262_9BACT|nr:DUF2314 domain-containing protein [Chryseolinea lacunae]MBL0744621.1 DUF2314 domain-containing protein [Chryseolinea lacunae]
MEHAQSNKYVYKVIVIVPIMKNTISILFIVALLAACGKSQTTERAGEPDVVRVEENDAGMNAATAKAIQTLDTFKTALTNNNPAYQGFSMKMRFDVPNGGEHIWISEISYKDGQYYGVVDNLPEATTNVSLGDTVKIEKDRLSDWMFLEDGKLRGGYTIRVLRDRMSAEERKQFDEEIGLIIED